MGQKISTGRLVLFAFEKNGGGIEERPARVVRVWEEGKVNLVVDVDGSNDSGLILPQERSQSGERTTLAVWRTSVMPAVDQDKPQANTWRWPPRV
jgi:hypothetical protein